MGFGHISEEILSKGVDFLISKSKDENAENIVKLSAVIQTPKSTDDLAYKNVLMGLMKAGHPYSTCMRRTEVDFHISEQDFLDTLDVFLVEQPNSTGINDFNFQIEVSMPTIQALMLKMQENQTKGEVYTDENGDVEAVSMSSGNLSDTQKSQHLISKLGVLDKQRSRLDNDDPRQSIVEGRMVSEIATYLGESKN